ncbi:MAG: outer membrane protein assembly factor, partial [Thermodesulfovibrionales bacterium]|nr:outer membrane protein assembly factor [Thermodesulfovibrionales bacterium]
VTAKVASFLLFSETDFAKMSFYLNNYFSLSKDMVFATSLRGGIARGFRKTQELPLVERFFLGGRTTVRGYEQDGLGPKGSDGNPTGGNLFAMGNLELRSDIGKGIGLVNFLDFGNVWQRTDKLSGIKYTTGVGLRYNTPVGPLRVDYGFKLNRDKGDSKGALHFSLGHAF